MAINKVVYGNSTLIDLTEDTVSANNLLAGETAHDRSGASIVGSVVTAEVVDNLTTQDATKALSAKQGYVLNQNKVDKVTGKGLSTNDYTTDEKTKLAGISAGAEPNVQSDWKQSDSSSDDFIKNKPTSDIKTSDDGQFTTVTGGLMQSCVVDLEPIQSGSGTPSPSNVRAISGHTQVDVWNDPKYGEPITWNQLIQNGNFANTDNWVSSSVNTFTVSNNVATFKAGAQYQSLNQTLAITPSGHKIFFTATVKSYTSATNVTRAIIRLFTSISPATYTDVSISLSTTETKYQKVLSIPSNIVRVTVLFQDNATSNWGNITIKNVNFVDLTQAFGETVADYIYNLEQATTGAGVAYFRNLFPKDYYDYNSGEFTCVSAVNGDTYIQTTINLGGTYYGGTLDAVSGKLTITHAHVDLGSYTWNKTGANLFFTEYPRDFKKAVYADGYWYANGDCECYKFIQNLITSEDGVINLYFEEARSYYRIFVNDSSRYSLSASDFKTAVTGQYLVYELATPQTVQLTPTQLETLVGQNDVFAPLVGQTVEEVEFREVLAWEDVPKAIPYECVDPIMADWFTIFKIHRYGRVVVLKFDNLDATPVASEDGWVNLGRLPERFYHKYPNQMSAENMIFGVINDDNNTLQMKKLIIDQYNGDVKIYFLANEQIKPLGSITYILDHD